MNDTRVEASLAEALRDSMAALADAQTRSQGLLRAVGDRFDGTVRRDPSGRRGEVYAEIAQDAMRACRTSQRMIAAAANDLLATARVLLTFKRDRRP